MRSRFALVVIALACCAKPKDDAPKPRAAPLATERDPVPPVWGSPNDTADLPALGAPSSSPLGAASPPAQDFDDAASCAVPTKCAGASPDASASVTLQRTACFGTCPVYTVTVRADGRVTWKGERHVATLGEASATIDPKKARELVDALVGGCFLAMREVYYLPLTDHPWANTTLSVGGQTKTVRHNVGDLKPAGVESIALPGYCSAPPALDALEKKIDAVAGTARWINKS